MTISIKNGRYYIKDSKARAFIPEIDKQTASRCISSGKCDIELDNKTELKISLDTARNIVEGKQKLYINCFYERTIDIVYYDEYIGIIDDGLGINKSDMLNIRDLIKIILTDTDCLNSALYIITRHNDEIFIREKYGKSYLDADCENVLIYENKAGVTLIPDYRINEIVRLLAINDICVIKINSGGMTVLKRDLDMISELLENIGIGIALK